MVKFWEKLPKSKRPSSKSYEVILASVEDPFTTAKLAFFSFLSTLVEPYLRKYQTDQPMIPFMFKDLKSLIKSILAIIVKPETLEKCAKAKQLIDLNLDDKTILLTKKDMDLGYGVKNVLNNLKSKDIVSLEQINTFLKEAQTTTKILLRNLLERTPLSSEVIRCAHIFNPEVLRTVPSSSLLKKMKSLLSHLMKCNILSPAKCDEVASEFRKFLEDDLKKENLKFQEFDHKTKRLDEFFFRDIDVSKYNSLSFVFKLIFTLSHGQAAVERGFSINNNVLLTNMKEETMVARKMICDHMRANNLKPDTININTDIIKAARGAAMKWKLAQEDERKAKESNEKDLRKEILSTDMEKLRVRCEQMKKTIKMLETDYGECLELADKTKDMSYVSKGVGLKRKCEETKKELDVLEKQYSDLEAKRKKL